MALSISYWAIDITKWNKGCAYIWLVFGMNAIAAYVFSEFLSSVLHAIHTGTDEVTLSDYLFIHCFCGDPLAPPGVAGLRGRYRRRLFHPRVFSKLKRPVSLASEMSGYGC
ncbi:MAG: hypothetical protein ACYCOR_04620 [Acidobacteriaceae bacterium]